MTLLKGLDKTSNYSEIGGALAFAVTIASMESASKASKRTIISKFIIRIIIQIPIYPLGNILGGGAHAGPGTPDIQEILICATGSKTIRRCN